MNESASSEALSTDVIINSMCKPGQCLFCDGHDQSRLGELLQANSVDLSSLRAGGIALRSVRN